MKYNVFNSSGQSILNRWESHFWDENRCALVLQNFKDEKLNQHNTPYSKRIETESTSYTKVITKLVNPSFQHKGTDFAVYFEVEMINMMRKYEIQRLKLERKRLKDTIKGLKDNIKNSPTTDPWYE